MHDEVGEFMNDSLELTIMDTSTGLMRYSGTFDMISSTVGVMALSADSLLGGKDPLVV